MASRKVSSSFLICEMYIPPYSAATRQSSVSSPVVAKLAGTYSRAELTPMAPSSMAFLTSSFIESISSTDGERLSYPTVWILRVAVPTKDATLVDTPFFSRYSRYSPSVVHSISYFMSPCDALNFLFMLSLQGPHESPSPSTSRVTPCTISLIDLPSSISDSTAQLSMLINPGATVIPLASISVLPLAFRRSPMAAMVSDIIPISPLKAGEPDPSAIFPFRMSTSYVSVALQPKNSSITGIKALNSFILNKEFE
ncbi:MAG: hypothetical protein BWY89_01933 [Bacteroidetes bacterium ADurb.BinA012]|nr:MAG: hypothetical protein BWY89_01933 [Bacteroidetes bacterium ADurb.BinA012]